jgi:hypothetical protein
MSDHSAVVYRHRVDARFWETVCLSCLKTLAYSPEPDLLKTAETAHRCPGRTIPRFTMTQPNQQNVGSRRKRSTLLT